MVLQRADSFPSEEMGSTYDDSVQLRVSSGSQVRQAPQSAWLPKFFGQTNIGFAPCAHPATLAQRPLTPSKRDERRERRSSSQVYQWDSSIDRPVSRVKNVPNSLAAPSAADAPRKLSAPDKENKGRGSDAGSLRLGVGYRGHRGSAVRRGSPAGQPIRSKFKTLQQVLQHAITMGESMEDFAPAERHLMTKLAGIMGYSVTPTAASGSINRLKAGGLLAPIDGGTPNAKSSQWSKLLNKIPKQRNDTIVPVTSFVDLIKAKKNPGMLLSVVLDLGKSVEDYETICGKILQHIKTLVQADNAKIYVEMGDLLEDAITGETYPKSGIIWDCATKNKIVNLTADTIMLECYNPDIDGAVATSWLSAPLVNDEVPQGVLRCTRTATDALPFSSDDELMMEAFVTFAAPFLRQARVWMIAELERRKSAVILELAKSLSSKALDSNKLVSMLVEDARRLTSADRCSIFIVDEEKQQLEVHFDGAEQGVFMPLNSGIAGDVAMTGKTENIEDAYADTRFNRNFDLQSGYHTQTILCMPIKYEDKVVAVAQLVNKINAPKFTRDDEDIFFTFSMYAGVSLRNARLYERATHERAKASTMLSLAQRLSTEVYEEEQLVQTVMENARSITLADRCSLFILDKPKGELVAYFGGGVSMRIPIESGIAGTVAITGQIINIEDAYEDPRFNKDVDIKTGYRTKSILCMPVICDHEVVAVAQLINKLGKDRFSVEDEELFSSFGAYAGIALRNSYLYKKAIREREKSMIMLTLAQALASNVLNSDSLVNLIMDQARKLVGADRCSLFILDNDAHELQAHFEGQGTVRMPINKGIAGHVAITGDTVNIPDAYEDSRFNKNVDLQTGYRTKSILCMPVHYENMTVAVAQLVNKLDANQRDEPFTKEDEVMFGMFATYAGVTLRNSKIHQDLVFNKRRGDALMNILGRLSSTDLRDGDHVLSLVVECSQQLVKTDGCSIFVIDKERNELWLKARCPPIAESETVRFPAGQGIVGEVATKGHLVNVRDTMEYAGFEATIDRVPGKVALSVLTMPVKFENKVVAVLQLVNKLGDDLFFTEQDEGSLSYFTMFAAIAVQNQRLYDFAATSCRKVSKLIDPLEYGPEPLLSDQANLQAIGPLDMYQIEQYLELEPTIQEKHDLQKPSGFNWLEFAMTEHRLMVPLIVHLFQDLGLMEEFKIDTKKLHGFLINVKRMHRRIQYHGFHHAADTAYQTFHLIKAMRMHHRGLLSTLEEFGLMIAAVCHDVDHPGINNHSHFTAKSAMSAFMPSTGTPGVLEAHSALLAIKIMQLPFCDILSDMDPQLVPAVHRVIIDSIMATDMLKHKELLKTFNHRVLRPFTNHSDVYTYGADPPTRAIICKIILKAADMSNGIQPFDLAKEWAVAVSKEFYHPSPLSPRYKSGSPPRRPSISPTRPLSPEATLLESDGEVSEDSAEQERESTLTPDYGGSSIGSKKIDAPHLPLKLHQSFYTLESLTLPNDKMSDMVEDQIRFIREVATPFWRALVTLLPSYAWSLVAINENRKKWEDMKSTINLLTARAPMENESESGLGSREISHVSLGSPLDS